MRASSSEESKGLFMKLETLLKNRKLLMWDFDGTLVNSEPLHHEAYARVLADEGYEVNRNDFGKKFNQFGLGAFKKLGIASDPIDIYQRKQDVYKKLLMDQLPETFQEIPALLNFFRDHYHMEMIVVTNSYRDFVERVLKKEGLENFFQGIYTRESGLPPKPSPALYEYALKAHKRETQEALVFEDGLTGLEAAMKAKLDIIWFQSFFTAQAPQNLHEVTILPYKHALLLRDLQGILRVDG